MSNCETVAWGECDCCGGAVAIKRNRSQKAYYRCDHCGVLVQHHWQRTSDKVLAALGHVEKAAQVVDQGQAQAEKIAPKKPATQAAAGRSMVSMLLGG